MKKMIKLSMVTLSLLVVSGCMSPDDVHVKENQNILKTKTNYSSALRSVNDMITIFNGHSIHVKVNNINDAATMGGKLPVKLDTVVNKSFNKIGNITKNNEKDNHQVGDRLSIHAAGTNSWRSNQRLILSSAESHDTDVAHVALITGSGVREIVKR